MTVEERLFTLSENISAIGTLIENGGYGDYNHMIDALSRQHNELYSLLLDMQDEIAPNGPEFKDA